MSSIKHFKQHVKALDGINVLELELSRNCNLITVRNPSLTTAVYFADFSDLSASKFINYAEVQSGGIMTRPYEFRRIYLYAAAAIANVIIEEYIVEDPAIFIPAQVKPPTGNVSVISSVLPAGGATAAKQDAIISLLSGGATGTKITAVGVEVKDVKVAAGKVYAVRAGAANVTLLDNADEKWFVAAGSKDDFHKPINCATSIKLSFAGAGDAWIVYE